VIGLPQIHPVEQALVKIGVPPTIIWLELLEVREVVEQ
jgi:hypothetical protein